jgi:hypothetical protein
MKLIDLTGQKFGRLTVIKGVRTNRHVQWLCRCECGNETVVAGSLLRNGNTRSCGCLQLELVSQRFKTHGHSYATNGKRTPTYNSWYGMIQRCTNSKHARYPDYGGRGITVCDRWQESFENFLEDMDERPEGMTIDRIDNDGNYEPGNCKWSTAREQRLNQRPYKPGRRKAA